MFIRHSLFTAMFFFPACLGSAWGQSAKPTTLADLAKYTGADRGALALRWGKKRRQVFMVHVADCEQRDR